MMLISFWRPGRALPWTALAILLAVLMLAYLAIAAPHLPEIFYAR